jgi:EpsI family protein
MIFRSKYALLLTVVLLLQGGVYYAVASRSELTPQTGALALFPTEIGAWHMMREYPIEKEVQDVLKADDTMSRDYLNAGTQTSASLFIAYFKTQRYGQSPHSPKNCLPGSGWEPTESGTMTIDVPNWQGPIRTNRYVVERGEDKVLTIYWYQSHNRVIASEYWARFWLVVDAIRYRRSDTSLVRVMVPVREDDIDAATRTGVTFVQSAFPAIGKQLPK